MTWKQLIESFLMNPTELSIETSLCKEEMACVSIYFPPTEGERSLLRTLSSHFLYNAVLLEQLPNAELILGDDVSLQLLYKDSLVALEAALAVESILVKQRAQATISIGHGEGIRIKDSFKSIELLRAKRLNYYSNVHELSVTENYLKSVTIPDGIGSFKAPIKLQNAAGFVFWILKDYR